MNAEPLLGARKPDHENNKVHHKYNISRIFWYSDWLHNTTSARNSIFVSNHNTTSCQSQYYFLRKKYYATYQTAVEYMRNDIWRFTIWWTLLYKTIKCDVINNKNKMGVLN